MFLTTLLVGYMALPVNENRNYIQGCSNSGLNCRLSDQRNIPDSKLDYHASFKVSYDFSCGATINPTASKIYLTASTDPGSRGWLNYLDKGLVEVTGNGPIRLEDSDPEALGTIYQNPKCGLFITSVEQRPSDQQIITWEIKRKDIIRSLNAIRNLYRDRPTVLFWKSAYSRNPESFRPLIESQIERLREQAKTDPLAELDLIQYEAILNEAPDQALDDAFIQVKNMGFEFIERGTDLVEIMIAAGLDEDSELLELCDSLKAILVGE